MKYLLPLLFLLARITTIESAEPPIYSLMLVDNITLSEKWIPLHQYMAVNSSITTDSGSKLFNLTQDGITVIQSGLYRLSFYQRIFGNSSSNECTLSLYVDGDEYLKRYQALALGEDDPGEITFTQILRLSAGQKLMIDFAICNGSIILESNFNSSGFTIEAL